MFRQVPTLPRTTIIRTVDANRKVVTQLPLRELWRDVGFSTTARGKSLTADDVREFLASGRVQFVIADVGFALHWIPASESIDFARSRPIRIQFGGTKS